MIAPDPDRRLTDSQEEILALLAAGYTNPAIAAAVFKAPSTIKWHLGLAYDVLEIDRNDRGGGSRVAAAIWWWTRERARFMRDLQVAVEEIAAEVLEGRVRPTFAVPWTHVAASPLEDVAAVAELVRQRLERQTAA